ncbi:MAG: LysR family transcriptional regulator [Desulfovibrio fairfieldensis]
MKISHLETFAKLAVTGSFTRAAHDLFTTQPTVTTHIQLLEQELGYQLFTRSRNSVRLTENGKMLFQKVEEIFRLMDSIKGAKTKADDGLSGTLNIAASSVMGANYLPRMLKAVFSEHPGVNIQLKFGNSHSIASRVDDGFVDIGFAPVSPGFTKLNFTPLLVEPCVLVTASSNYAHYKARLEEGSCNCNKFVLREKGTKIHDLAVRWLKKQPFYANGQSPSILWNMESIKNFILEGAGMAILPRCCIENCLQQGDMREIATDIPLGEITYCMIERQNEEYNETVAMFRALLTAEGALKSKG